MKHESTNSAYLNRLMLTAQDTWETAVEKLSECGFDYLPESAPPFGEWVRVSAAFKDATNKSAAVMVTDDGQAVHLFDHTQGCGFTVRNEKVISLESKELRRQRAEREQMQLVMESNKRRREAAGIENARQMFENASPCDQHTYLTRKSVDLPFCRIDSEWLLVPLTDIDGNIQSLQRIAPDGTKRLLAGAPVKGSAYRIGIVDPEGTICIAEEAATGASVYKELGHPVVCAMTAGNLKITAEAIRKRYPNVEIIIAGDDDRQSKVNIGRKKAIEAAEAVDGKILLPSFCDSCDGKCSDHNDTASCRSK